MNSLVVIIDGGDCRVCSEADHILVTNDLGSCIAVVIYDPVAVVGGMLHFMLPESAIDRAKAQGNPFVFADTGSPLLFQKAFALGAEKQRLIVTIAGGAQMLDSPGTSNVGKKNYMAMRKILWKTGVLVKSEEVGGSSSRTVHFELASGRVVLQGSEIDLQPGVSVILKQEVC
jgi:chemotaxis protein CheD